MVINDVRYWTLALKQYLACQVNNMATKEKFGEEGLCECCWNNIILATGLIDVMQCYQPTIFDANTNKQLSDNCYTDANEAQIKKIFGLASSIINKKGGCD